MKGSPVESHIHFWLGSETSQVRTETLNCNSEIVMCIGVILRNFCQAAISVKMCNLFVSLRTRCEM